MDDIKKNWKFWLILILIVIFFIWLFLGGGNHEFIGLSGLSPNNKTSDYISPQYANYLKTNTPSYFKNTSSTNDSICEVTHQSDSNLYQGITPISDIYVSPVYTSASPVVDKDIISPICSLKSTPAKRKSRQTGFGFKPSGLNKNGNFESPSDTFILNTSNN